ncbi:MAG: arsenate reductase ArsC [Alphaproteobacteria bacterium]
MKDVLILCTGNSCRSIMAEALINYLAPKCYNAVSAGSNPTGEVHPKSIETLIRNDVVAGNPRSKSWDEFDGRTFDIVITVCDAAATESCPIFLGADKRIHWSIPDPAHVKGNEVEINNSFDGAFNMLKNKIEEELL